MGRKKGAAFNLEEQRLHTVGKVFGDGARVISHNPGSVPEQGLLTGKRTLILNEVLKYHQQGFSVIPIQPKEKRPLVAWEPYQTEHASEETLIQWFTSWPDANVGIVTGAISDLVVIDCDSKDATRGLKNIVSDLKPIPRVKTGHGWHFFFKYPGKSILNRVGVLPKMDVRGDGGYVVAPPSVHSSGKRYEWQISLNGELPALPAELYDLIVSPTNNNGDNDKRFDSSVVWEGIPDGERDDLLFRYGCQLRSLNAPHDVAKKLILEAASRCKPPFPEQEALQKLEQAWKYDAGHPSDKKSATRKPILDTVSEIEREEVSWLGRNRIPRRKITIVEGDPGQGKSFLTQALAAAVSLGFCFPDDEQKNPENVIIMSAEDGAGDTIRPRLEDMQGNLEKLVLLRGMTDEKGNEAFLTLADLDVIEKAIIQVSPALVIIDPIIAYVAGKDTHKASEVRSLLAPLGSLAEKHNVAIVCVRHLNKGNMKSNYRGQGSIDFLAACRSAFLCGPDPENPKLKVFCHIKSNVGPIMPSLNYSIENGQFVWGGEVQTTPEQILADSDGKEKSRLEEAMDFLKEELDNGAVIVSAIEKDAKQLGISWGTVKRARYRLGIKVQKRFGDLKSPWEWKLKP